MLDGQIGVIGVTVVYHVVEKAHKLKLVDALAWGFVGATENERKLVSSRAVVSTFISNMLSQTKTNNMF